MGITLSKPTTCGCERQTPTEKHLRIRQRNTTPPPPSNQLSLTNETSYGFSQDAMDVKTMQLLLTFDDSFSPTTSAKKLQNLSFEDTDTIRFIRALNEVDYDVQIDKSEVQNTTSNEKVIAPINKRLSEIQNVSNLYELEDTIRIHYDTSYSGSQSNTTSSIDENEMAEIERLKTDQKVTKVKKKSNVFRQHTANPWNEEDIDDLHNEMTQQFLDLANQTLEKASDVEIYNLNSSNQLSQSIFVQCEIQNDGGLYRDTSDEKWNKPLIGKEKDEMRKQMMYLAKQNITKNGGYNEENVVDSDESDMNDGIQYVNYFNDD